MTPAKIRAVLRRAGYECAKSHTTRVRGWHSWSPGFQVREDGGVIVVRYRADHPTSEREAERLAKYEAALTAAGIPTERNEYGRLFVPINKNAQ